MEVVAEVTAQIQSKEQEIQELKENIRSMQDDMKNIFEVLRIVKRNDGRVGTDKTVLDENRNITLYQEFQSIGPRWKSRCLVQKDSSHLDSHQSAEGSTIPSLRMNSNNLSRRRKTILIEEMKNLFEVLWTNMTMEEIVMTNHIG